VALKTALLLDGQVKKLVLIEPNPFSMLRQQGRMKAYLEARALRDHVKCWKTQGRLCRGPAAEASVSGTPS
jgi:hypothetical protein